MLMARLEHRAPQDQKETLEMLVWQDRRENEDRAALMVSMETRDRREQAVYRVSLVGRERSAPPARPEQQDFKVRLTLGVALNQSTSV